LATTMVEFVMLYLILNALDYVQLEFAAKQVGSIREGPCAAAGLSIRSQTERW